MEKYKRMLIVTIVISIIYTMYVYYYYNNLQLESFVKHTVGSINILGNYIKYIFDNLVLNIMSSSVSMICITLIFLLRNVDFQTVINSINGFEWNGVKISKERAKERIDDLELQNNAEKSEDNENKKIEKEILEVLIDNEQMVKLIDEYLKTSRGKKIPLSSIPRNYKVETIGKIFEYKTLPNSIKITGLKKEIESILIDVFNDLKEKNIIYCEA